MFVRNCFSLFLIDIHDPPLAPFVQMGTLTSAATPFEFKSLFKRHKVLMKRSGPSVLGWEACRGGDT